MSKSTNLPAPEALTDADLADVNGGASVFSLFLSGTHEYGGVGVIPSPGFGSYVTRIGLGLQASKSK
ncbi:MAG: hypothetical protein RL033_7621 [Pseudomonadota bacterium]|jgi:hypothetical protein